MSALLPSPTSRNWREKGEMVGPAVAPLGRWRLARSFRLQNLVPRSSKFAVVGRRVTFRPVERDTGGRTFLGSTAVVGFGPEAQNS